MKIQSPSLWWLRIATFALAALAAASAAYWVLKWSAGAPVAPGRSATPVLTRAAQVDPLTVARLLGGGKQAVAALSESAASRFKLLGVVAANAGNGYALISVDGKPARPYRVGAAVNDSLVVRSVAPRSAALAASADAPPSFTLELPAPNSGSSPGPATPSEKKAVGPVAELPRPTPVVSPPIAGRVGRARSRSSSNTE